MAVHENFDRFVGVCVEIFDTLGTVGMEGNILLIHFLAIRVLGGNGQIIRCPLLQAGNGKREAGNLRLLRSIALCRSMESDGSQLSLRIENQRADYVAVFVFDNEFISCCARDGWPSNIHRVVGRRNLNSEVSALCAVIGRTSNPPQTECIS